MRRPLYLDPSEWISLPPSRSLSRYLLWVKDLCFKITTLNFISVQKGSGTTMVMFSESETNTHGWALIVTIIFGFRNVLNKSSYMAAQTNKQRKPHNIRIWTCQTAIQVKWVVSQRICAVHYLRLISAPCIFIPTPRKKCDVAQLHKVFFSWVPLFIQWIKLHHSYLCLLVNRLIESL